MTIYRLWCAKCRDLHEIDQSLRPVLVNILLRQLGSGCDGLYYRWTDDNNQPLEVPRVRIEPFPSISIDD